MASEQKAMSRGGCGCSSKAVAAGPETPVKKSGCCGGGDAHDHNHHAAGRAGVVDPVCGMTVDPATSKHRFDFRGVTYHFCSAGCQTTFAAAPERYLDKANAAPQHADVPEGTVYTCPMHPQIRQIRPGSCPICGCMGQV